MKELTDFDKKRIEIIRDTHPKWMRTWCKRGEEFIMNQSKELIEDIKRILQEKWSGGWGGISYGTLPMDYKEWLKENYGVDL